MCMNPAASASAPQSTQAPKPFTPIPVADPSGAPAGTGMARSAANTIAARKRAMASAIDGQTQ